MEKEIHDVRSARELNADFRKILAMVPDTNAGVQKSGGEQFLVTEEEKVIYAELSGGSGVHDEIFVELAKEEAQRRRRGTSEITSLMLERVTEMLPNVKGTESFKTFIPNYMRASVIHGIGTDNHLLYGDDMGGIFNPVSVEGIEEKSLQHHLEDIRWFGMGPLGPIHEGNLSDDPVLQNMIAFGNDWITDFGLKYGRGAMNIRGRILTMPNLD